MPGVVNVRLYPRLLQFTVRLGLAMRICVRSYVNHVCVSPAAVIGCILSVTFDLCGRVADVTA